MNALIHVKQILVETVSFSVVEGCIALAFYW